VSQKAITSININKHQYTSVNINKYHKPTRVTHWPGFGGLSPQWATKKPVGQMCRDDRDDLGGVSELKFGGRNRKTKVLESDSVGLTIRYNNYDMILI